MDFHKKYLALFFLFCSGVFFWIYGGIYLTKTKAQTHTETETPSQYKKLIESKKVQEAYDILSNNYYKFSEHSFLDMEDGMIRGIVWSLEDKHSDFFTPDEAKEFHETLSGDFEWIGAVIGENPTGAMIEKIIKDSPAEKAGLTAGKVITEINDKTVAGTPVKDIVKKIRWPKWTTVKLKLVDPVSLEFETKTVTRNIIIIPSVSDKMLTGWVVYIEISIFWEKTAKELATALKTAKEKSASGIIIDLRHNGWGYLDEAVDMLSNFLPKNLPLVITKETDPRNNITLFSKWGEYLDIPLVFIVNDLSASASEIMVWAIQDYDRGIVVGEKTYGKWSVQQPFILADGSELKITIAKWYTPKERWIDGTGIEPDITVRIKDEDFKNKYDRQLEESRKILLDYINTKDRASTINKFKQ